MGKFNKARQPRFTWNLAGGSAYRVSKEHELLGAVLTSFVDQKFYESQDDRMERIRTLIASVSPDFVCRLAVYARQKMNLRAVPLVLLVELLKTNPQPKENFDRRTIGKAVEAVLQRADDIGEILGYYQVANSRQGAKKLGGLAQQLKEGIASAFFKFDEYQLAKYDRQTAVRLRDALFLTHPKPRTTEQQDLFTRLVNDELAIPYTWETQLSARGNTREVWEELLSSGRLGYMALIRNLRNIVTVGVSDECLSGVCRTIEDTRRVAKSKLMPWRFLSAYLEIADLKGAKPLLKSLERAVLASALDEEFFRPEERVLIAADVSGSMTQALSGTGNVLLRDVGLLLASVAASTRTQVTTGIFGTDWKVKDLGTDRPLGAAVALRAQANEVGTATYGYKVLEWALREKQSFDKILFFTDCQLYSTQADQNLQETWRRYRKVYPGSKVYFVDLAGHGTNPLLVDEERVFQVSGLSDRVFEMLAIAEQGQSLAEQIRQYEW